MAAGIRIIGRNAHQAVHAAFGFQLAIGVVALDLEGAGLDAGLFAVMLVEHFDLEFALVGPARVHAHQHRGPVLAFGAAGAGIDLHDSCHCRRPRPTAAFQAPARPHRACSAVKAFSASVTMPWSPSSLTHLDEFDIVGNGLLEAQDGVDAGVEVLALAHHLLGFLRIIPERWDLRPWRSVRRAGGWLASQSKMPPQQADGLLHFVNELGDFCAHDAIDFQSIELGSIEAAAAGRQLAALYGLLNLLQGVQAAPAARRRRVAEPARRRPRPRQSPWSISGGSSPGLKASRMTPSCAEDGALAGLGIDGNEFNGARHAEWSGRLVAQGQRMKSATMGAASSPPVRFLPMGFGLS